MHGNTPQKAELSPLSGSKTSGDPFRLSTDELRLLILPVILISEGLLILCLMTGFDSSLSGQQRIFNVLLGVLGSIYSLVFYFWIIPVTPYFKSLRWLLPIFNGVAVSTTVLLGPSYIQEFALLVLITFTLGTTILFGRLPGYAFILTSTLLLSIFSSHLTQLGGLTVWGWILSVPILGIIIIETVSRMVNIINHHLRRMRTLNDVASSLSSSIEISEVFEMMSTAIQSALQADTYYIGMKQNDEIRLELLYDGGEFFPPTHVPIHDSLSGYVVRNNRSILLQHGAADAKKIGVELKTVGKARLSQSWMGAPMEHDGEAFGVVAVASYTDSAFTQRDLELLENIAQQASMAIDNARHHSQVEQQSRLDSLTGTLNHYTFLSELGGLLQTARSLRQPVSIIMLDIDHFKQYNDQFGHLVGDRVLTSLAQCILSNIKSTDLVGRWGGEEFIIALPNAHGSQANAVAHRLRNSLRAIQVLDRSGQPVAPPTISQGISVFPEETQEMYALIDLADKRLYHAKENGRDQVAAPPHIHPHVENAPKQRPTH